MATYSVQHITKDGAFCGQTITNRPRAILLVQDSQWVNIACVIITIAANSQMERLKLRATAVSQVFHERKRAVEWIKLQLADEEQS